MAITALVPEAPNGLIELVDSSDAIRVAVVHRDSLACIPDKWKAAGVYLLLDPIALDGTWGVYVGKAISLANRVKEHNTVEKPTWIRAVLVMSDRTEAFTTTEIGWLEGHIYQLLSTASLARPSNKQTPGDDTIHDHEQAVLRDRSVGIQRVLRLLGYETSETARPVTADIPQTNGVYVIERYDGREQKWFNENGYHREDGPAILRTDGTREWWLNGKKHREDGPAYESGASSSTPPYEEYDPEEGEYAFGVREWWLNGQRHRDDGPARELPDGTMEWYCNDRLHREEGPAVERADGAMLWYCNGYLHREDGPAFEHPDGVREWWLNGQRHREDGPSVEHPYCTMKGCFDCGSGYKEWYIRGQKLTEDEFIALQADQSTAPPKFRDAQIESDSRDD